MNKILIAEDLFYVDEMDDSKGRSGGMKLFYAGGTTVSRILISKTLTSWLLEGPDNLNQKCLVLISENSVRLCTPNLLKLQIIQITTSLFSRRFKRCDSTALCECYNWVFVVNIFFTYLIYSSLCFNFILFPK